MANNAVLIQCATGEHTQLLTLTQPFHKQYCDRHAFDYWCTLIPDLPDGRHPMWMKVALIRKALAQGYDYVVWLDADTLIVDHEADLREACPREAFGLTWHSIDWGAAADVCYDHWCTGAVYMGRSSATIDQVERWWNAPPTMHPWQDQDAFNHLAERLVVTIDPKWNSIVPHFESPTPVVMAWHGYGTSVAHSIEERRDAMAAEIAKRFGARPTEASVLSVDPIANTPAGNLAQAFADAKALFQARRLEEARLRFEQILALHPCEAEVLRHYCEVLGAMGEPAAAEAVARKAIALEPTNGGSWALLAGCKAWQGAHEEAGRLYEKALGLAPDMPVAHWNYALNCLMRGDYRRGWKEYQWGQVSGELRRRTLAAEWDGRPIPGGALHLWAEQGHGDAIQLVRFLPRARRVSGCAKIVLECHESLVGLFAVSGLADEVYALRTDGAMPWDWDAHASLMSLPRIFGTEYRADDLDAAPYLSSPALQLPGDGLFKVGVCWRGNPGHPNDRNRSIPFELWEELLQTAGCAFFNLDKPTSSLPMADWQQTAALVAGMNLIITVDTALAHLAGALGKPVWILLPHVGDFRWGAVEAWTHWYPSAQLYRQCEGEGWQEVLGRVQQSLGDWKSESPNVLRAGWAHVGRSGQEGLMPFADFESAVDTIGRAGTTRHARLLYGLVRWLRPRRIVEVGTWFGYTANWMARALQENGSGEIVCIDDFSLEVGALDIDALQTNIQRCDTGAVMTILPGKSQEVEWPSCDMAYIDGDHSYEGCAGDVQRAIQAGAMCIAVHDTVSWWGVRQWMEQARQWDGWDVIEAGFDEGLGVLMKRPVKPSETYSQADYPSGAI